MGTVVYDKCHDAVRDGRQLEFEAYTGDLQALMDEAVGLIARTLDVELAGVVEMPRGGGSSSAPVGWREGVVGKRIGREAQESLLGYTLRCREPVVADDIRTDPRFKASGIARTQRVVSALSVMIEAPDEPFGALAALSTSRRTFPPSDVSFVQAVANVLASAVERSRAGRRLMDARELEHSRIARALHGETIQALADALVLAMAARRASPSGPTDQLISVLQNFGKQLRGAIYDLRLRRQVTRVPRPWRSSWTSTGRWRAIAPSSCRSGTGFPPVRWAILASMCFALSARR